MMYNRHSRRIGTGKRYEMGRSLGKATDLTTREKFAAKLEHRNTKYPQALGIPKIKQFGPDGDNNVMIMELLGPSVEELFTRCGRRFTLKTTLMLADQMLKRLEFVHSKGFIHRDVKPDNFLMGRHKKAHVVYIIDFGLTKKFRDGSGRHIPFRNGKSLTGTARYASINNHLGMEQGRRDDLESLGHILLYFLRGKLPWQGLYARTKKEKYDKIRNVKEVTSIRELCRGMPEEFVTYMKYVRKNLQFDDKPDYQYLRKMFKDCLIRKGYKLDYMYDWVVLEKKKMKRIKNIEFDKFPKIKSRSRSKRNEFGSRDFASRDLYFGQKKDHFTKEGKKGFKRGSLKRSSRNRFMGGGGFKFRVDEF